MYTRILKFSFKNNTRVTNKSEMYLFDFYLPLRIFKSIVISASQNNRIFHHRYDC